MGVEIERKFLVKEELWNELIKPVPLYLKQAFVAQQDMTVVRIREYTDSAKLTIKGKTTGISKLEFEYAIPLADAQVLINELGGPVIEKDRFHIQYKGQLWEVDVFYGDNEVLIVAEAELDSENQLLELPNCIKKEVSHDPRYFNSNLQLHPFKNW